MLEWKFDEADILHEYIGDLLNFEVLLSFYLERGLLIRSGIMSCDEDAWVLWSSYERRPFHIGKADVFKELVLTFEIQIFHCVLATNGHEKYFYAAVLFRKDAHF